MDEILINTLHFFTRVVVLLILFENLYWLIINAYKVS